LFHPSAGRPGSKPAPGRQMVMTGLGRLNPRAAAYSRPCSSQKCTLSCFVNQGRPQCFTEHVFSSSVSEVRGPNCFPCSPPLAWGVFAPVCSLTSSIRISCAFPLPFSSSPETSLSLSASQDVSSGSHCPSSPLHEQCEPLTSKSFPAFSKITSEYPQ
jgi:hypothetical protein